ncbi:MAG: hypothetical protein IT382_00010 [Deltaproteobacteria bacterium]|nr:hypothetical protein [Deltaproteobacteria bacterium]
MRWRWQAAAWLAVAMAMAVPGAARAGEGFAGGGLMVGTEIGYQVAPVLEFVDGRDAVTSVPHYIAWGLQIYSAEDFVDFDGSGSLGGLLLSMPFGINSNATGYPSSEAGTYVIVNKLLNVRYMRSIFELGDGLSLGPALELGAGMRGLATSDEFWFEPNIAGGVNLLAGGGVGLIWVPADWILVDGSIIAGVNSTNDFSAFFGGWQVETQAETLITLVPDLFWLKLAAGYENWSMLPRPTQQIELGTNQNVVFARASIVNNLLGWALGFLM